MAAITVQCMAQLPRQRELVVVPQWLPRPLNIARADLEDKWLAGVSLRDADARAANLQGAQLQGAQLQGAQLLLANLSGTQLQGAHLGGANLQGVQNLTEKQIESALTDEHTRLPDDLKRPAP
jgi:uncharacterized protein YjbI with pentapeptide repeats